jgi:hypothetical protein
MNTCCVCRLGISHTRRTRTQKIKQGMLGRPRGPILRLKIEIRCWE